MNDNQLIYLEFVSGHFLMLSELVLFELGWLKDLYCTACQHVVGNPFKFLSFILTDSLLHYTATIQKPEDANQRDFLGFLTSTEVLNFFAVFFQTGP